MSKILLVIRREFITRVRKKSFLIMTILGPLLMAAMIIVPVYISQVSDGKTKHIAILDETGWFFKQFRDSESIKFEHVFSDLQEAKNKFLEEDWYALLYIPKTELSIPANALLYSNKQPNLQTKNYIKSTLEKVVENKKLKASGIDPQIIKSAETTFNLNTVKIESDGEEEESFTEVSMALGIFASLMIYFFIFLFGAQVLRGVIEEKSSRIVEIIISSVKPFQLMLGKIIGIGLVGLTQFLLWIVLTFGIVSIFMISYTDQLPVESTSVFTPGSELVIQESFTQQENQGGIAEIFSAINSINFGLMIGSFIIFFLGGYLLYGALFAAIGGAVDNETDTQQFMLPITIPLIFSIIMAQFVINHPDSSLAFWLSIIPFTSPVIMMVRIPFGIQAWELWLSVGVLILGFLGTTWLAGRIYRTGILMYGSKVNYKTMWKWIKMRN